jgi:hypothetical protein
MDLEKFVRYRASTVQADKFSKTISYGAGTLSRLLVLASKGRDSDVSTGLKQLASSISMARYVTRFTGTFEAYEAIKNGSWCYGDDDKHLQQIVKIQAYSMLLYYPLENISYVGYMYVNSFYCQVMMMDAHGIWLVAKGPNAGQDGRELVHAPVVPGVDGVRCAGSLCESASVRVHFSCCLCSRRLVIDCTL